MALPPLPNLPPPLPKLTPLPAIAATAQYGDQVRIDTWGTVYIGGEDAYDVRAVSILTPAEAMQLSRELASLAVRLGATQ